MANIVNALDAALRARYMPKEIRRPITHRQGLTARLNALGRVFGTQKQVAAALGINERTLRNWKSGRTKISAKNLRKIEGTHNRLVSLPRMRANMASKPAPNSVNVTAIVTWNGYRNSKGGGQRTVTFSGVKAIMARVIRVWATAGPEASAAIFQRALSTLNHVPNSDDEPGITFDGDDVDVSIPWENP